MAKIASDGAKLAQAASQHAEKMLADSGDEIPSAENLKAKLAAKYKCSTEQVEAILDGMRPERN